jgi:hypothetical protein
MTKIQPLVSPQPSSPSLTKTTKNHPENTNSGDQQKGQKRSKNQHKKGPEITKKEASSIAFFSILRFGSPPSLDLDLYFSESADLPEWWRRVVRLGQWG